MSGDLLEKVRQTYRNSMLCGREGAGAHRGAGSAGRVSALCFEAIAEARAAGLDWQGAMRDVINERKNKQEIEDV